MVILLQLCLFLAALAYRGRRLLGLHLEVDKHRPDSLSYTSYNEGKVAARHIGVAQRHGIPYVIRPERGYYRFLKNIGIASELELGEESFDHRYFFATDFPGHVEDLLRSGALKQQVRALFELPVKSLHAVPGRLWCVIQKQDMSQPDGYFDKHREILAAIAAASQRQGILSGWREWIYHKGFLAFLFIAAHAALLGLGALGGLPTILDPIDSMSYASLYTKGLLVGVLAAALWFALIVTTFARTPWVCWVLADFLLCGVAGFLLSGIVVVREANIHLPQPPAQVYTQHVQVRECALRCKRSAGKRSRYRTYRLDPDTQCKPAARPSVLEQYRQTERICAYNAWFEYHVTMSHWAGDKPYRFQANEALFDRTGPGAALQVPVHPGGIGIEWVDTDRITPQ